MSDVPNVTRQEVTVRARHRFFLEDAFEVLPEEAIQERVKPLDEVIGNFDEFDWR
jgi:hypothetical protein